MRLWKQGYFELKLQNAKQLVEGCINCASDLSDVVAYVAKVFSVSTSAIVKLSKRFVLFSVVDPLRTRCDFKVYTFQREKLSNCTSFLNHTEIFGQTEDTHTHTHT